MMLVSRVSSFVVLLYLASFCSAESLVPVLAWSNSDILSDVPSSSIIYDTLYKLKPDKLQVAVVLKSSKLSFDDIAKYGGVYGEKNAPLAELQSVLSTSQSTLSTGVSGQPASDVYSYLAFAMATQPAYVTEVKQFPKLDKSRKYVIVVELPGDSGEEMFREHGAIISEVVSTLSASELTYAVFYTADHSSHPNTQQRSTDFRRSVYYEDNPQRGGMLRPVPGDESVCYHQPSTDGNSSCLLFCFTSPVVEYFVIEGNETRMYSTKKNGTLPVYIGGVCNSTEEGTFSGMDIFDGVAYSYMAFELTFYENVTADYEGFNRSIVFAFAAGSCNSNCKQNKHNSSECFTECGFWTMRVLSGDNETDILNYRRSRPERVFNNIAVPLTSQTDSKISYACGKNSLNKFISVFNGSVGNESYQFTGIQVQPFANLKPIKDKLVFGAAYNCQGYFGTVTWMGVFSILILIIIFYISIVCVFSINSLDKFDDARGPTINVENLH